MNYPYSVSREILYLSFIHTQVCMECRNGVWFLNMIFFRVLRFKACFTILCLIILMGCDDQSWNDPYPYENAEANTRYSAFSERPKHLDPARSYAEPEYMIIAQIYEPPLQYHYLKRPYTLEPLSAAKMPEVKYIGKKGETLDSDVESNLVSYTDYIIHIKPNMYYQNHPAFAKDATGQYRYQHLSDQELKQYQVISDFKEQGTREVIAEDYVYQIKRLAEPHLSSPIYGIMNQHIVGLKELRETLMKDVHLVLSNQEMDLRAYPLSGVEVLDRYTYRIRIKGKYPPFQYWLAMPFFVPIPWEVALFYAQPGLEAHNISLDWYPVGTGPYMLTENNPDRRMVLVRNPLFHGEHYPSEGTEQDAASGLLADAGKPLPMIDKVIFSLEKEDIPRWNKFLQGYYDASGINADNFGSTIRFTPQGLPTVTEWIKKNHIRLQTSVATDIWFWGFNFLDETVGGNTDKARLLRQAISLGLDVEEYISIFLNGRGVLATGPIPPDIFGSDTQPKTTQHSIVEAKALLKQAGFKDGLTLYFDTVVSGDPSEIERHAWLKEQFKKLGIRLVIRGSDFNRFQEKVKNGNVQLFFWGWNADYPDPENFLFLFYGPNSSAQFGGENMVNYNNPIYDRLFEKMRVMPDGPERRTIIQEMINILEKDRPWVWGFNAQSYALYQNWVRISKPGSMANNTLKYERIDPVERAKKRLLWNQPIVWPMGIFFSFLVIAIIPAGLQFWRKEHRPIRRV